MQYGIHRNPLPKLQTMIVVIATIRSVAYFSTHNTQMAYAPMHESDDESAGERFSGALINVLIILCVLITMTFLLVLLYKYRCYRVSLPDIRHSFDPPQLALSASCACCCSCSLLMRMCILHARSLLVRRPSTAGS